MKEGREKGEKEGRKGKGKNEEREGERKERRKGGTYGNDGKIEKGRKAERKER